MSGSSQGIFSQLTKLPSTTADSDAQVGLGILPPIAIGAIGIIYQDLLIHRSFCAMPFGQMRLRTIIFLLGLLTYGQVNGQLILTEEENLSWINKLKEEKQIEGRLNILRTRILADTNVYVKNIGDRVILETQENKNKELGLCRPLLIVEGYYINITNDTDPPTVENLVKELTTDRIKQFEVVDGEKAKSLFGQSGWCGVILLTTTHKKAKKALLRYKI